MNEEITQEKFDELRERLKALQAYEDRESNIFDAVGVERQEVKHSAFIAWLLDPNKAHGLGNKFLTAFCQKLLCSDSLIERERNQYILQNLCTPSISSIEDLAEFLNDKNIKVFKERVLVNAESRIDIYIESQATKTAIVIENKVFTGNHDDQLRRYIEEIKTYGKIERCIYVYLTPEGILPDDTGTDNYDETKRANAQYCLFSYRTILDIIAKMKGKVKDPKTVFLMEDYIKMVKKNITKEDDSLREKCKAIYREYKDIIDKINEYNADNAKLVMQLGKSVLEETLKEKMQVFKDTDSTYECYTTTVEKVFATQGESIIRNNSLQFLVRLWSQKGDISVNIGLFKADGNEPWSLAQIKIAEAYKVAPKAYASKYFIGFKNFVILKNIDREKPFEEIKDEAAKNMKDVACYIEELEKFFATIY